ncbi:hypothetical protein GE09DRAFT_1226277 [Coniochaeta sp. 2T2.1]|nr:hypothetical protein GE09DRAFT_1226277 [Coniochaeta sp. 2T2.1]
MGSLPPPSPSKLRPRSRDTGFPSSFDGQRNTTLPHPDADLSPNASISADDIAIGRVLSRQRRSFLAKHRRTVSHGIITPEMERTHSGNLVLLREEENEPPLLSTVQSKQSRSSSGALHQDGASFASSDADGSERERGVRVQPGGGDSPTSDHSFESTHQGAQHGHKRRRSLLRRLMHR